MNEIIYDNCTIDEIQDMTKYEDLPECGEVLQTCKVSDYELLPTHVNYQ